MDALDDLLSDSDVDGPRVGKTSVCNPEAGLKQCACDNGDESDLDGIDEGLDDALQRHLRLSNRNPWDVSSLDFGLSGRNEARESDAEDSGMDDHAMSRKFTSHPGVEFCSGQGGLWQEKASWWRDLVNVQDGAKEAGLPFSTHGADPTFSHESSRAASDFDDRYVDSVDSAEVGEEGLDSMEPGKPAHYEVGRDGGLVRPSSLRGTPPSAQTTVVGGISEVPSPNSGDDSDDGLDTSHRSSQLSARPPSLRNSMFEGELQAHSALVTASISLTPNVRGSRDEAVLLDPSVYGRRDPRYHEKDDEKENKNNNDQCAAAKVVSLEALDTTESLREEAEMPIRSAGSYRFDECGVDDEVLSHHISPENTPSATSQRISHAVSTGSAPAAMASVVSAKPRPFLKKGARMPKYEIPKTSSMIKPKPESTPHCGKGLKLQPRAYSQPAVSRNAGAKPTCLENCAATSPRCTLDSRVSKRDHGSHPSIDVTAKVATPEPMLSNGGVSHRHPKVPGFGQRAPSAEWGPQVNDNHDTDWADTVPWDYRAKIPDGVGLEDDVAEDQPSGNTCSTEMPGEPPTSQVVRSYFSFGDSPHRTDPHEAGRENAHVGARLRGQLGCARGVRHSQWDGDDAYATLYAGPPHSRSSASSSDCGPGHASSRSDLREADDKTSDLDQRRSALEQQIKQYGHDREVLKKLQARAEQAERDVAREREKLWREVEAEKGALHAEFDVERAALKRERRRLSQNAERHRQHQSEERELLEENRKLRERVEHLEEEMKDKDKRWQRTVDRLQRQVAELTKKNLELHEDVKRATSQVQQAQPALSKDMRRSTSVTSTRGRRSTARPRQVSQTDASDDLRSGHQIADPASQVNGLPFHAHVPDRATLVAQSSVSPSVSGLCDAAEKFSHEDTFACQPCSLDVKEIRTLNGRAEKIFTDGRKEIEFANGLRKVMWVDGRTTVLFQNGDRKEIHIDGVVVYHYAATGATQTTLPCGDEVYEFADGQHERHRQDGSKEIRFPNGTTKNIFADGSEEVCFADGTVRRTGSVA